MTEARDVVADLISDSPAPAPRPQYENLRFRIVYQGQDYTYSLKDYEHPQHQSASKPRDVIRYGWLGPLREDYTRYENRAAAEAALAKYLDTSNQDASKVSVRVA